MILILTVLTIANDSQLQLEVRMILIITIIESDSHYQAY
jgi:hypothetical protein